MTTWHIVLVLEDHDTLPISQKDIYICRVIGFVTKLIHRFSSAEKLVVKSLEIRKVANSEDIAGD